MDYQNEYKLWCARVCDETLMAQLKAIENDDLEQKARFSSELTFGTAGLRGILGAGTSRMNVYTVRRTSQGLADHINATAGGGSVAISYDSRNMSAEFAKETARVLAANGITAYLYDRLMPTPMLSFAVRELHTNAGVMITASHNPAQYNGYKAYGPDGCQMTSGDADAVYACIQKVDMFDGVKTVDFEAGLADGSIVYITDEVIETYYKAVLARSINADVCKENPVRVVYSALNGTGNEPVRRIFAELGVTDVHIVKEQELPDGDFPTCTYPNPETKAALALGLALCDEVKPDLFIATDPDADRVGVAFKEADGSFRILTGNEVGALLLNYIIEALNKNGTMPKDPVAVRSIVSTALSDEIAKAGGVEMRTVLTGFKYIGEQVLLLEQKGEEERFIFGFEESCGYLSGGYVRDKDAVFAAMMLCEMTAYYKSQGKTVLEVLGGIYDTFGYYMHRVANLEFAGIDGVAEMAAVMAKLYAEYPADIAGFKVVGVTDYKARVKKDLAAGTESVINLPAADVIEFLLDNGATVMVRPSGTEPKMKIYMAVKEPSAAASAALLDTIEAAANALVGRG